jgi:P-type Cu2+ transporter
MTALAFDSPAAGHDFAAYATAKGHGEHRLEVAVEGVHCGACIARIEAALRLLPEVHVARVNLSTRRLQVEWTGASELANEIAARVAALGFTLAPFHPARLEAATLAEERQLLRALAIAGFAAGNVMLLSVSVWAGHVQDMGPATRALFHWLSALIVLPAVIYSGRPFFLSALSALRGGGTNMDVPISIGVLVACAMSLYQTWILGPDAYFDSAITLLFFLLVGRYLDRRARGRAREAVERLLALGSGFIRIRDESGRTSTCAPERVRLGMLAIVTAGERIAVDGRVREGHSEIDTSLITGETLARVAGPGDYVFAGTLNRTAPLSVEVAAVGETTLLAEIVRLMEAAEQRRSRFVALADRVARAYAPVVHAVAALTFLGWWLGFAVAWDTAILHAVAVLIVTCPCALALAVPAVQVIASGRLMRRGVLLKSATALERLAAVDIVVFDKTGTLTLGAPRLLDPPDPEMLEAAAALAGNSRHPLAQALSVAAPKVPLASGVEERPGEGLLRVAPEGVTRLGSRRFCDVPEDANGGPELWLRLPGRAPYRFAFADAPRSDAAATIAALRARGLRLVILSGDRPQTVASLAAELGIADWRAGLTPAEKVASLEQLKANGRKVMMVGDGLNDAPALAAAHVSVSPASAVEVSQAAADAVFQGERLAPVLSLLDTARLANRLVRQNIAFAILYNLCAVPLAIGGWLSPLIAAVAMSSSSILVVANALRLGRR